ncbi:MAG: acyl-CoA dehydrogenase, partial [Gemmatimonadota bacterium]
AEFGPLAGHLRVVNRASRKLARSLFHAMVRFGPKLEKKQSVLFRLVDVGAELLAISAVCAQATALVRKDPSNRGPIELADIFARHSRRKVRSLFRSVFRNDDDATYQAARRVLDGKHRWLEEGIAGWRS